MGVYGGYIPKASKKDLTRVRTEICRRAEVALRELHLSSWTEADKKRLARVERALRALDDVQAEVKGQVEDLLVAYEQDQDVGALVKGLKGELPRPTEEVFDPLRGFATLGLSSAWGSCNFCTEKTEKVWGVRSNVPGCTVVVRFCPACFKQVGFNSK